MTPVTIKKHRRVASVQVENKAFLHVGTEKYAEWKYRLVGVGVLE